MKHIYQTARTMLFACVFLCGLLLLGRNTAYAAGPTVYNGVDYAAVYDYDYYIGRYADLRQAFGSDAQGALRHFVTFGMRERRQAKADFNVTAYANTYEDLRNAFGTDYPAYYRHYIRFGLKEGRKATGSDAPVAVNTAQAPAAAAKYVYQGKDYTAVFDPVYYSDRYADLKRAFGYDAQKLLRHYVVYGIREGRVAKAGTSAAPVAREDRSEARAKLDEIGWDLRAAFNWCMTLQHNRDITTPDIGTRAMAHIGFSTGTGGCYPMAACFYEMAKELGYDAHQISGFVPRSDGSRAPHSWVEIDTPQGIRVYDISTMRNYKINTYGFTYGTKGTWRYIDYYRMN